MTLLMQLNVGLAALNAVLALAVAVVFYRNHRQIKSPFTLALTLFALFFVFHNSVLLYHFITMMGTIAGERLLLAEGLLQLAALSALAYATLR